MADISSIIKFAAWLGKALGNSATGFDQFTTESAGIELPDSFLGRTDVKNALSAIKSAAVSLHKASNDLGVAGLGGNEVEIVLKFALFATLIIAAIVSAQSSRSTLRSRETYMTAEKNENTVTCARRSVL